MCTTRGRPAGGRFRPQSSPAPGTRYPQARIPRKPAPALLARSFSTDLARLQTTAATGLKEMLLMKANRDAILKPLQTVAGIVERRHTLPILANVLIRKNAETVSLDRKSTRLNSSHVKISYAVCCLTK